jgi:hypothetical protein
MLTFNTLLRCEGIDPASVRLVRHQDTRGPGPSPYERWRAKDGRFGQYQRLQKEPVNFGVGHLLASFVAPSANETLFVGLYRVDAVAKASLGTICPVLQTDRGLGGHVLFDIQADSRLSEYVGLLIIEWGPGFRSWIQRAERQEKPVLEIRREAFDPAFPGFREFRYDIDKIEAIPFGWREALRSVNGIYPLVCHETGKQYVGAAYGQDGLWGRFLEYARTGHGGNIELLRRGSARYQVSVLEVIAPTASQEDVTKIESAWKDKLRTRDHGLNEN